MTLGRFSLLPPTIKVKTREQAEYALSVLRGPPSKPTTVLAVDTETTGLSRQKDRAIILSISSGYNRVTVFQEAFEYFRDLLENPELKLIMWNANFDTWMLRNAGIDIYRHTLRTQYRVYDAMVMHALAGDDRPHSLKFAARDECGIRMVPFKTVFGEQMSKRTLQEVLLDPANEEVVSNYAGLDSYATLLCFLALRDELLATNTGKPHHPTMWHYFIGTEVPFTRVLFECEQNGVALDSEALLALAPGIEKAIMKIVKWFARMLRNPGVNLNSTDQMIDLFFNKLGYEPPSYTDGGAPQVAANWLKSIAAEGDIYAKKLLKYRDLSKKLNTYITGLLKLEHRGRVHTSFRQTGARTGRLSSADPNLQNQPQYIRVAYIASKGFKLFARDYEQLEMRILAHFSGDATLIHAIQSGQDVHSTCAAKMFNVPYEEIMAARKRDDAVDAAKKASKEFEPLTDREKFCLRCRKGAKGINFALMYGQGPRALSLTLGIPLEDAKELIATYFREMPRIKIYLNEAISAAKETGVCSTILGRKRHVSDIWSPIHGDRASAERKVKNTPIQGTGADVTKMAMIRIYEDDYITASGFKMLVNIHDEILGEAPAELEHDEEFNERFTNLMEHPLPYDLVVELATSGKWGDTWAETH